MAAGINGARHFIARCNLPGSSLCLDKQHEVLTLKEQMELSRYSWADMSRAITKLDKQRTTRPGEEEAVSAVELAAALKPPTTEAVARIMLEEYCNEAPPDDNPVWGMLTSSPKSALSALRRRSSARRK